MIYHNLIEFSSKNIKIANKITFNRVFISKLCFIINSKAIHIEKCKPPRVIIPFIKNKILSRLNS